MLVLSCHLSILNCCFPPGNKNNHSSFWPWLFHPPKGTIRSSFSSSLSWYRWHMRKATAIQRYGHLKVDLLCKNGQNRDFRPWPDIFKKSKITLKPLLCQNYCIISNNKDQNIHLASLRSKSVVYLCPHASSLCALCLKPSELSAFLAQA